MIIDSHAHYAYPRFDAETPYLSERDGKFTVLRGKREDVLAEMQKNGIIGVIEPSIGFDAIEKQYTLVKEHTGKMWAALGVHPTRCPNTPFKNMKALKKLAIELDTVAIGETGLDYHHPRREQHRIRQKLWFNYQLKLADALKLPLVLHIRAADTDALKILKKNKALLHGGVVHCFSGDSTLAREYVSLGFAVGIGGKLLIDDETGKALCDTVKNVPLTALLVETDAPFVLPDINGLDCNGNQRKKLCNTSLILPAVLRRIAEIRGEAYETVENAVFNNTVRIFDLKPVIK